MKIKMIKKLSRDSIIFNEQKEELENLINLSKKFGVEIDLDKKILEKSSDKVEEYLKNLSDTIRYEWLKKTHRHSLQYVKSPYEYIIDDIATQNGTSVKYGYERTLSANEFEKRFNKNHANFYSFSLIYDSGMSAILSSMILLPDIYKMKSEIKGVYLGGYFETVNMFKTLASSKISFKHINDETEELNLEIIEQIDFLFFEPIKYNFSLEPSNLDYVFSLIKKRKNRQPIFLIIDSTLQSLNYDLEKVLDFFSSSPNVFIINLRSTLKLDQEGLEISNSGLLQFYLNNNYTELGEKIKDLLIGQRSVYGLSPSFNDICALDYDGFSKNKLYTSRVLDNNRYFYNKIKEFNTGLIKEIVFPEKNNNKNTFNQDSCPFILIKVKNPNDDHISLFVDTLNNLCGNKIMSRNSFGFRNISLQFIKTIEKNPKYMVKIAVGYIRGKQFYDLIDAIEFISKNNNYNNIK